MRVGRIVVLACLCAVVSLVGCTSASREDDARIGTVAQAYLSGAELRYGRAYRMQNGSSNWSGGYLDIGATWSIGPRSCPKAATTCVSTLRTPDRSPGSGTWILRSAT